MLVVPPVRNKPAVSFRRSRFRLLRGLKSLCSESKYFCWFLGTSNCRISGLNWWLIPKEF